MKVTVIPGDGIGPEVTEVTLEALKELTSLSFEVVNAGEAVYEEVGELVPKNVYESLEKNKVGIKGPITTPIGKGFSSINVGLRKKYDLYQNIRPIKFNDIDLVIFRENTEGLYIGEEQEISNDEVISIKRITRKASLRIIRAAFEYAKKHKYSKVTVAHKANILKKTDGLFLNIAREVASEYEIPLEEVIVDNMCMQLVMYPEKYGVIVTMNLYGDILSDLAAGLAGGLGMIPGANIGEDMAIFEAVHGSAPDIAGKDLANPIALLRSAIMMLNYLEYKEEARVLESAIQDTLTTTKTKDLGGNASLSEFRDVLISSIRRLIE